MRKPFVPHAQWPLWPVYLRDVLARVAWMRGPLRKRSAHRHRKAGRA